VSGLISGCLMFSDNGRYQVNKGGIIAMAKMAGPYVNAFGSEQFVVCDCCNNCSVMKTLKLKFLFFFIYFCPV